VALTIACYPNKSKNEIYKYKLLAFQGAFRAGQDIYTFSSDKISNSSNAHQTTNGVNFHILKSHIMGLTKETVNSISKVVWEKVNAQRTVQELQIMRVRNQEER